ncbi:Flavin mononucleotide phosphatase YigB [Vibrio aerogenes CECT 7868]|uniref:Flavin mononucleotide phosphatase YigB n=1 Tax=Vibrio aerogenes CECT 7868 TaxID=1216006 RepID=A0A1M5ZF01_9VIBR|nr:5-amino-6-(5-phospho-D-ribitylamino)uracil phosphatase YigB [Vibrio aerogenes]SHI22742.1 Flavin mononucleotide phosphatase YigB [Vibrio aerogenes CECT 7868]
MHYYRNMPRIRAMTFDLDDTLYDNGPVIRQVEKKLMAWMHTHHPVTASCPLSWWQQQKQSLREEYPEIIHDVTQWRFQSICRGMQALGYDEEKATAVARDAIVEVLYWRNQIHVPQETHQVLQTLAEKIPLIAITNGNASPEKIGLSSYFQQTLKAGPDGFSKPHSDLFIKARQALSCPAGQILHIGDHLRTDVAGAKLNGFSACWMNVGGTRSLSRAKRSRLLPDVEIHQLNELLLLVE